MRMGGVLILAAVESLTLTEAAACSLPGPRCLAQGCLGSELKGAAFVKTHLSDCLSASDPDAGLCFVVL